MAVSLIVSVVSAFVPTVTAWIVSAGIATGKLAMVLGSLTGAVIAGALTGTLTQKSTNSATSVKGSASGMLINKKSNNASIPVLYGSRKMGGTLVFVELSGTNNEFLNVVLAVCEGEINSFNGIQLNGVSIFDSRFGLNSASGHLKVEEYKGTANQAASNNIPNYTSKWTSAHRLRGIAYIFCQFKYNPSIYPNGIPTITCFPDMKLYDIRTDQISPLSGRNPAICIYDYLTNTRYGRAINTSLIDNASFTSAANYCDEVVVFNSTQSGHRYECHGVVDTSAGSMAILEKLLSSCKGFLIFSGGKYKLIIDKIETPAFTFSEDNIIGSWSIAPTSKTSAFNRITANYFNQDQQWQPDLAIIDSPTLRGLDNGLLLEKQIELPFTKFHYMAKAITTINLNQSRQQMFVEFTATVGALVCEVTDVVYVKHKTPAWDTLNGGLGKKFRVMKLQLQNNDEVRVSLIEYEASSYNFGTIANPYTISDTDLPDLSICIPATNAVAVESLYSTIGSGGVKARVVLSWTASVDPYVISYEVLRRANNGGVGALGVYEFHTNTVSTSTRFDDVAPAPNGYDYKITAVNSIGVHSAALLLNGKVVNGLTAPPGNVLNLTFAAVNGFAHFSWDLTVDLDVKVGGNVRFKHSSLTSGATWNNSVNIGKAIGGHNTNHVLPLLTGSYMAKFVDSAGNESVSIASFISTSVPSIIPMNLVENSVQNPAFTGTKTDLVLINNALKFEADTLWDSFAGLMDTWTYIDSMGGVDLTGTYEFDNYIDLGNVFNTRSTGTIAMTSAYSDVDCDLYVASTQTNPASSPTWSAWAKFNVADIKCRALKYKAVATTLTNSHQINITGLSVKVEFPDRTQGARALQTGTGTLNVTYPTTFKVIPFLGLTFINAQSNDVILITNETATGFTVGVQNSSSYVDRKFNYLARGY